MRWFEKLLFVQTPVLLSLSVFCASFLFDARTRRLSTRAGRAFSIASYLTGEVRKIIIRRTRTLSHRALALQRNATHAVCLSICTSLLPSLASEKQLPTFRPERPSLWAPPSHARTLFPLSFLSCAVPSHSFVLSFCSRNYPIPIPPGATLFLRLFPHFLLCTPSDI